MSNSKLLDGLSGEANDALNRQLWEIQNHRCFICGEEIDLDIQKVNVDHIRPLNNGGKDDTTNLAITHEHCYKAKEDNNLEVAEKIFRLRRSVSESEAKLEPSSFRHVRAANVSPYTLRYNIEGDKFTYKISISNEDFVLRSKRTELHAKGELEGNMEKLLYSILTALIEDGFTLDVHYTTESEWGTTTFLTNYCGNTPDGVLEMLEKYFVETVKMDTKRHVVLLAHTPEPERIVVAASRLCYSNATIPELLEQVSFTFGIEGVSRAMLARITRHRIASFSVQSQRYVAMNGFDCVVPPSIAALGDAYADVYRDRMKRMDEWYRGWLDTLGEQKMEDARFDILPANRRMPLVFQGTCYICYCN